MKCTTITPIENGKYPCVTISWTQDVDSLGWTGAVVKWINGEVHDGKIHVLRLTQSIPLGTIYATFDAINGGCWKMTSFNGVNITERDLQWAGSWATLCKESKDLCLKSMEK